jgi:hypothetical protein
VAGVSAKSRKLGSNCVDEQLRTAAFGGNDSTKLYTKLYKKQVMWITRVVRHSKISDSGPARDRRFISPV